MPQHLKKIAWLAAMAFLIFSCKKSPDDFTLSRLDVRLVDSPADYDSLIIQIDGLQIELLPDTGESDWKTLSLFEPMRCNVLALTGGISQFLGAEEIPPQTLKRLRLKLGAQHWLFIKDQSIELNLTPEEQNLDFELDKYLAAKENYRLVLDFDAALSVTGNPTGNYGLKPKINTFFTRERGSMSGILRPLGSSRVVIVADKSLNTNFYSAFTNDSGQFILEGLPTGTYDLFVFSDTESKQTVFTQEDLPVNKGQRLFLDTLRIP